MGKDNDNVPEKKKTSRQLECNFFNYVSILICTEKSSFCTLGFSSDVHSQMFAYFLKQNDPYLMRNID